MNNKHYRTLEVLLANQIPSNLKWRDVKGLLIHLGATVKEGRGSRIRVYLNGRKAIFHEPHPSGRDVCKCTIRQVNEFLEEASIHL